MAVPVDRNRVPCVLAQLVLGLLIGVLIIWLVDVVQHVRHPVDILVDSTGTCIGAEVYVDGRHHMTISKRASHLSLTIGWHIIEARKSGFSSARTRFRAESGEQYYTTAILLRCKAGKNARGLQLIVDAPASGRGTGH